MRISWFLGFGWLSIATVILCGVGINMLGGWMAWVLYVPFVIVAIYMTVRFKLYNSELWRRVHGKAMISYARLASSEYDAAKSEIREFKVDVPCRGLAELLFSQEQLQEFLPLLKEGRKAYYNALVESYPHVFVEGLKPEKHASTIEGVHRDVDASQLGPDIFIAKALELKYNRLEAARYLHALLLGRVR